MISSLIQDARYGLRLICKAPGFNAVAIVSLAVGIGASTVAFSFVNALLLRPVQAAKPEQLIQVFTSDSGGGLYGGSSYADYEDFTALPVFSGLLASARTQATLSGPERSDVVSVVSGVLASGNYFEVLGLQPSRGRFFTATENQRNAAPVVVISHDAWERRFGADPEIVGRVLELNGRPFTVIGVGPPRFVGTKFEYVADFFAPAAMHDMLSPGSDLLRDRRQRSFSILGRLPSAVTLPAANAALRVLAADLHRHDPGAWSDRAGRARTVTAAHEIAARFAGEGPGFVLLMFSGVIASVAALLAIACVNVATVLLARATTRRKEIAVRLAIGASRGRVVRQLLTECALLAAAGGALGLVLAQTAAVLFLRFRPDELPAFNLTIDYRIFLFAIAVSAVAVAFFGLAPALQTTRPDVNAELKGTLRAVRVRGVRFGLRSGLVVIQVALSLALLVGAALMIRSSHAGRTIDPGFRRNGVINIGINLSTIPDRGGARGRYYEEAVRAVASLQGVERVALAGLVPMDGSNSQRTIRIGAGPSSFTTSPDINEVGAGYFALLDIAVRQGREFTAVDRPASPLVAVVNETMAQRAWHGDAMGKVFTTENTNELFEVVGVVRDLRHRSFAEDPIPMVYFCAAQQTRPLMTLHVRTAVARGALVPAIQKTLHELNRSAGLTLPESMAGYIDRVTLPQRLGAAGAIATGALELALAVMALYGVIAFAATQRRSEIGLRMALGASSRSLIALVMRDGLLMTAAGIVLGVGIALAGAAGLGTMLIGVGPADPVSFTASAVVLLLVGGTASYIPARRAAMVDPSTALRSE
jgi:putative ABC transport system permease protein